MPPAVDSSPFSDLYLDDHSVQPARTPIQNEFRFLCDWTALRFSPIYYGVGVPQGNGEAVVIVPGFMGTDLSMMELYWWLARIGYQPYYSELGLNVNCPDISSETVLSVVRRAANETGARVHLLGHSLGALIARNVAFRHPELIDLLISLAAPFNDVAHVHPVLIEAMAARPPTGRITSHLARRARLLQRTLHLPLHREHHAPPAAHLPSLRALRRERRPGPARELHGRGARVQHRYQDQPLADALQQPGLWRNRAVAGGFIDPPQWRSESPLPPLRGRCRRQKGGSPSRGLPVRCRPPPCHAVTSPTARETFA